jgi:hypothetical protein
MERKDYRSSSISRTARGFSLAEVLMATGILALGMVFVAGLFPAAIYFTAISTERTMAVAVADEAFAKVRLYGVDVNLPSVGGKLHDVGVGCVGSWDVFPPPQIYPKAHGEFLYPSDPNIDNSDKKYCWSALYRRVSGTKPGETLVQVTVFVCRKTGVGTMYYRPPIGETPPPWPPTWPAPVQVNISKSGPYPYEITITETDNTKKTFITAGSTIVEDTSGMIYRVQRRDDVKLELIYLDRPWQGGATGVVWVIPPPVGGGRQPCVGVFQKEMLF